MQTFIFKKLFRLLLLMSNVLFQVHGSSMTKKNLDIQIEEHSANQLYSVSVQYENKNKWNTPYLRKRKGDDTTTDANFVLVDDNDDENVLLYTNIESSRRRLNSTDTSLSYIIDHTKLSEYDSSQWSLFFLILLASPLVAGITCGMFFMSLY